MRDQILNLLARNTTILEICEMLGISKDQVEALVADKAFILELKELKTKYRQENIEESYAKLEERTLKMVAANLEYAEIPSLCRVLETVSKNRVLYRNPAGHYQNPTAHLTIELKLPAAAGAERIVIDEKTSQIVAIGERSMVPLPIAGVQKLFGMFEKGDDSETIEAVSTSST